MAKKRGLSESWLVPALLSLSYRCIAASATWATEKTLRSGRSIPTLGLQVSGEPEAPIAWATSFGYRMLDIAGNESSAGQAIRQSSVPRSRLFLSAKLFQHGFQEAHRAVRQSLQRLHVDYVDLYMMASPVPGKIIETWDAVVEMRKMGLARTVGVCDFELLHLEALKSHGRELPEILQLRVNPLNWQQQKALLDWSAQHGILIQATNPFQAAAALQNEELHLAIPALQGRQKRTPAQVLLRWAIQMDFQVITKSRSKDHIFENADVWSFDLADDEMKIISALGGASPASSRQSHAALDLGDTSLGNRSRELANPAVAVEL